VAKRKWLNNLRNREKKKIREEANLPQQKGSLHHHTTPPTTAVWKKKKPSGLRVRKGGEKLGENAGERWHTLLL